LTLLKLLCWDISGYAKNYSLYDGRIFMFIICNIAEVLKISIKSFNQILLSISLIISSICVLKIYEITLQLKETKNKLAKIILFFISYNYIFNFTYIDNMQFSECIIMSISILLFITSSQKIILQNKKSGLIYCILGVLFYQGTINIFITTSILFLLINPKREIKKIILIGITALISVIADIVMIKIIQIYVTTVQSPRMNYNIINNIKLIISNLSLLINKSLNLYPRYLHIILAIILLTITYIYSIKKNKIYIFYFSVFIIIVCYASCFLLGTIYDGIIHEGNGRVFNSVGAMISAVLIYAYVKTDILKEKIWIRILGIFTITIFGFNIINTFRVTGEYKEGNEIDKEFSLAIFSEIQKYEKETNIEIKKFAIEYIYIDVGQKRSCKSMKNLGIYNPSVYKIWTNDDIERELFDEEIKEKYFKENEEKMICIGDTIYIQTLA